MICICPRFLSFSSAFVAFPHYMLLVFNPGRSTDMVKVLRALMGLSGFSQHHVGPSTLAQGQEGHPRPSAPAQAEQTHNSSCD